MEDDARGPRVPPDDDAAAKFLHTVESRLTDDPHGF
jgi:hypothetical protein